MVVKSADEGSPEYEEFLQLLGHKIELQGWLGYRADLDVRCMSECVRMSVREEGSGGVGKSGW